MHITHLSLTNYRNYSRLALDFSPGATLLQGDNAHGKTNLLESIAFLSTTRSVHARSDQQLVNWLTLTDGVLPFARVEATVKTASQPLKLAITITREGDSIRKTIQLNGVKKRAMDVIGKLTTVLFLPEDIELVTGAPSVRRRYLDGALCQISPTYCRALSRYNKIVSQRNALLKELFKRRGRPDELFYWDEQLATYGSMIVLERHQALLTLDRIARQRHRTLSNGQEGLRLCYVPGFDLYQKPKPNSQLPLVAETLAPYTTSLPKSEEVQQAFLAQLHALQAEEIKRGVTTIGPHRDEFLFLVDGVDMNFYGSRGQQRTTALSLKLAEVTLMQTVTQETPVLLLDDVMSELDQHRRQQILTLLDEVEQSFLTTTDWADFDNSFRERATCYSVTKGRLLRQNS